ncbi:MAG: D-TA family PLP-dependent enzyme, partial [Rhizobiaceae bacterium]
HIKTHTLPYWGRRQIEAGAAGITCQKIGEAEVFADAGFDDIFLPYNILGADKLARLKALHRRITLSVTVDNEVSLAGLAETFTDPARPLTVLVECDTGMGRCGVQSPAEALTLARRIAAQPDLRFGGLMTYPAHGKPAETEAWLVAARDLLAQSGLDCAVISGGNTPDMWNAPSGSIVTEHRPGTYIYMDRYQVAKGAATLADCAFTVLATVVSRPTATRAILDAGSKTLSSDTLGMTGFGDVLGIDGATVVSLSEEHGTVSLPEGARLAVGERVHVLPNHCCVVTNLFDQVYLVSAGKVVDVLDVAARGKVT